MNNILPLATAPHPHPVAPSPKYLHKRRILSTVLSAVDASQQANEDSTSTSDTAAEVQQDLITLGGRVYMTNITLANREHTLFLTGMMGTEELGIGGVIQDELKVRQTIGVVERGWRMGDGLSSGLMRLAYPMLASNYQDLNYTSVVRALFQDGAVPQFFSHALSRPTLAILVSGGLLAIGGIPDIPHNLDFVSVPIHPIVQNTYTFYSIPVDGFDITPPPSTSTPSRLSAPGVGAWNYTISPLDMIIDSGSSLLHVFDLIVDYIASLFIPPAWYSPTSHTYLVPCTAAAPRVGIIIAGKAFYIHEEDLMNKGPGAGRDGKVGLCTLAVMRLEGGDAVLGDSWLKGVLAVFGVGDGGMRFAGRENY
ncbi:acid protease [Lentithecium fluviatile CBS 122367]|uniref:Acid protease n=1 Tax=Lentithecium fluviatile CBS 122367 TaxID=1168545 RepID=A0A6G1IS33_9PLEO|nr:acid protease [Lentithecium fluviatile CBS 122367]